MKIKKILIWIALFIFGIWISFAAVNNFFKTWKNWDANISSSDPANDTFTLSWRLDLQPSRTQEYDNGYRWKVTWTIESNLFWLFNIIDKLDLKYYRDFDKSSDAWKCWAWEEPFEIYEITWAINSPFWWEMQIQSDSYFCSNQYTYLKLKSDSLWEKEVWNSGWNQNNLANDFDKQEIIISGIAKIIWDKDILAMWDDNINDIYVNKNSKIIAKTIVNKNIVKLTRGLTAKTNLSLNFQNNWENTPNIVINWEKIFYYKFTWTKIIDFNSTSYINEWKNLEIKWKIEWINTVIVEWWNIYIKDNLYHKDLDDKSNILVLVAKRNKETWNWWNIYIDPSVTNIDAVIIADGSLISMNWTDINTVTDSVSALRKQLLIYGSILSSNSIWTDKLVFWNDYYKKLAVDTMVDNIYDLWNLRTFNLNYWSWDIDGDWFDDNTKLVPIDDTITTYKQYAWAGGCKWFNWVDCDSNLRKSPKTNPIIIEYNSNIKIINPKILQK